MLRGTLTQLYQGAEVSITGLRQGVAVSDCVSCQGNIGIPHAMEVDLSLPLGRPLRDLAGRPSARITQIT